MRCDAMTLGTCDLVIVVELYTDVVSNWYRAVAHGALSCRMKRKRRLWRGGENNADTRVSHHQ